MVCFWHHFGSFRVLSLHICALMLYSVHAIYITKDYL